MILDSRVWITVNILKKKYYALMHNVVRSNVNTDLNVIQMLTLINIKVYKEFISKLLLICSRFYLSLMIKQYSALCKV